MGDKFFLSKIIQFYIFINTDIKRAQIEERKSGNLEMLPKFARMFVCLFVLVIAAVPFELEH